MERLGGEVIGPTRSTRTAAEILAAEPVDAALLDIRLDEELVYPLASTLAERQVPFVFVTGYDANQLPAEWRERPRIEKPVDRHSIRAELTRLLRQP